MRIKNYLVYIITILITFVLIFILTLHSQSDEYVTPVITKNKITIRIETSWGGSDTKAMQLQMLLNKFQKDNPNVKIINNSVSGAEFLFTLKTDFAQGNDPDVFGLWPGSDISTLIKAGKVADLTDVLSQDTEWYQSFGKDGWRYDTYNNKIYGLPMEIIYECLFINKDLFEKNKIKVPNSYEQLIDAVKSFRKVGIIPISWSATAEGSFLYQNMVAKLGGKNDVENPTKNGLFNTSFVEALKYLKQLYDLKAFPKDGFVIGDNDRRSLFLNKKAAMIVEGSWFIGPGALKDNDETIGMVPFPTFKEGKAKPSSVIYGIGNGNFHCSAAALMNKEKREYCIKLLKYLTSKDAALKFSEQAGFMSNVAIYDKSYKPGKLYSMGIKLVDKSTELIGPVDSFVDRNIWENVLLNKIPEVLEGKQSPEGAYKDIEKALIK